MSVAKPEPNGQSAPNPHPNLPVRGRPFEKGNGGRRPGSRNRTTLVAEALLKDEEVELVRKAIELAKAGDSPMLKFLLDRILPKDRSVRVDLPAMDRADPMLSTHWQQSSIPWVTGRLRRVKVRQLASWSRLMRGP